MNFRKMSAMVVYAIAALAFGGLTTAGSARAQGKPGLTLTTTAFEDGGIIPLKYTAAAKGTAVSPALAWTHVPDGTMSFALLEHDPDTSVDKTTTEILHWIIFNIPADARALPEGVPLQATLPDGSRQGRNYTTHIGYVGMGAPAPGPDHHYTFELFALDKKIELGANFTEAQLLKAMDGHILDKAVVVGRFHLP